MNNFDRVKEFHKATNLPIREYPQTPPDWERMLRTDLITEEYREFIEAAAAFNIIEVADALADLLYVTYGAALHWGIDIDAVFEEVHRSNMTKILPDGTVLKREDGKIIKPATFEPPNIRKVLIKELNREFF